MQIEERLLWKAFIAMPRIKMRMKCQHTAYLLKIKACRKRNVLPCYLFIYLLTLKKAFADFDKWSNNGSKLGNNQMPDEPQLRTPDWSSGGCQSAVLRAPRAERKGEEGQQSPAARGFYGVDLEGL